MCARYRDIPDMKLRRGWGWDQLLIGGGPLIILAKNKFAPNAIFRVVSCLYILYDLTCLILLKNSTHSLSYMAYRCFAVFFTSD